MASSESSPDLVELKHMVMSFRVSELQMLLRTAERSKCGRKHDLMTRALQLLKNGCSSQIQTRIKELYHIRFPRNKVAQQMSSAYREKRSDYDHERKKKERSIDSERISSNQLPVHPKVRFKALPFYEVVSEVVKPSSLISRAHRAFSKSDTSFILSEDQVDIICKSSSKDNMRKFNSLYQIQVQLRFCLLETTCEQNDLLPPNLSVKVNHHVANLPNFIPPSKAGAEPKRASRPIDITLLCRLSHVSYNRIEVSWSSEYGKNYAMCIVVVRQQTSDMLMQRLRRKGIRNAGHSRTLIKEKMTRDPDSEIATTSLKVSLLCPLGKMRMTVPARPATCTHMQCFDAMLFLQMNEKKPTWICPVCDKPADFSDLFIDGLFQEILSETLSEEIVFLEDGEWRPVEPKREALSLCTPMKNSVALDLSGSPQASPGQTKEKEPVIIDLTCDTDEETEVSPVKRRSEDGDREQEEIHSLSSTSPYRSENGVIQVEDKRTPPKRPTQQDLPWESAHDVMRSTGLTASYYGSTHSSPRSNSYNPHEASVMDRPPHPNLSHTPNFSIPGSRDNTPPLNMGPIINPANMTGFPSHLDYNAPSPLDFGGFSPYILNPAAFDPMRRIPTEHSLRSSPFSLSQSSNHLYPPSTHSSNEHIARSLLTSYPPPYHPYSPLPFLQQPDNPLDIIPID